MTDVPAPSPQPEGAAPATPPAPISEVPVAPTAPAAPVPPAPAAPAPAAAAPAAPAAPGYAAAPPPTAPPAYATAPAPAYAAAPAPTYAAAPAPGYAPYPGQPVPAGPSVPGAFGTWWALLLALFRGDLVQATDLSVGQNRSSGARAAWVIAPLVNGALIGLTLLLLLARFEDDYYYLDDMGMGPDGGDYVLGFLLPLVCAGLMFIGRVGVMALLFRWRGRTVTFGDAASLAAVPFVVSTPLLALLLVLSLVPGTFAAIAFLCALVFTAFYAELSAYVVIVRAGRFEKSAVLPHALLSTVWLCLGVWLCGKILADTIEAAMWWA